MPVYVVSYDLNRPIQHYEQLWDALKRLDGRPVLLAQWSVRARGNAEALGNLLRAYLIDNNDRLLVIDRDSGDWAGWNLSLILGWTR